MLGREHTPGKHLSDLDAREILAGSDAPKCHRLHFLQMAAEKVCKAYLTTSNGHSNVRKTHAYVAKNLPIIARVFYSSNRNQIARWEMSEIRRNWLMKLKSWCQLATMVMSRLDNSEYPWQDGSGNVRIPSEFNFPNIDDGSRAIIRLIKLIQRTASESYA